MDWPRYMSAIEYYQYNRAWGKLTIESNSDREAESIAADTNLSHVDCEKWHIIKGQAEFSCVDNWPADIINTHSSIISRSLIPLAKKMFRLNKNPIYNVSLSNTKWRGKSKTVKHLVCFWHSVAVMAVVKCFTWLHRNTPQYPVNSVKVCLPMSCTHSSVYLFHMKKLTNNDLSSLKSTMKHAKSTSEIQTADLRFITAKEIIK